MQIEMTGIVRRFGKTPAVDGVDLQVPHGEFLALLGPSGSGKTTLLRIMAGLESAEEGSLSIDGVDALTLPPNKRRIGFVFQNYALFRHMTVARNIAFGLEIRPGASRPPAAEIARRVEELLDLVQIPGLGGRYPHQISGGQRQRVALARALAIEPRILLLDEPFGALDTKVRSELAIWLKALHRRLNITTVFVTHDQNEAMEMADRIVVMRSGRVEQQGTPIDVYNAPASSFVYDFLDSANCLPCIVDNGAVAAGEERQRIDAEAGFANGPAALWFRPNQVQLAVPEHQPALTGLIRDISVAGSRARVSILYEGTAVTAELAAEALPALNLTVESPVRWLPRNARVFAR